MHVSIEKIVSGISRWENEGGALCSEWIASRESAEKEQEIVVSAGISNALKNSETPAKSAWLGEAATS
jgi:hypothetical protein